jgi:hypothetical protein
MKRERRYGCRERSPIHNTEGLFLQQGERLYVVVLKRFPTGDDLTCARHARAIKHLDIADASNGPGDIG